MGDRRRLHAVLFLMLHLVMGMRLAVPSSAHTNPAEAPSIGVAIATAAPLDEHAKHGEHGAPVAFVATATHPSDDLPCHRTGAQAPAKDSAPAPAHSSHHDAGCHSAPCCGPALPHGPVRAIATQDAPVARLRPLVGASRIIFADGSRRRPPATAPPASRLA